MQAYVNGDEKGKAVRLNVDKQQALQQINEEFDKGADEVKVFDMKTKRTLFKTNKKMYRLIRNKKTYNNYIANQKLRRSKPNIRKIINGEVVSVWTEE